MDIARILIERGEGAKIYLHTNLILLKLIKKYIYFFKVIFRGLHFQ